MEERKRPANHNHDDSTPPHKKQATSINGASKPHVDADMPWKDELEVSKDSILDNENRPALPIPYSVQSLPTHSIGVLAIPKGGHMASNAGT